MNEFSKYMKILAIILLIGFIIYIKAFNKTNQNIQHDIATVLSVEEDRIKKLPSTETIKTTFLNSIEYCNTLHIAQNGAYESCILDYIYKQSKEDYKLLMDIRKYCYEITDTEYERRKCIDVIITGVD